MKEIYILSHDYIYGDYEDFHNRISTEAFSDYDKVVKFLTKNGYKYDFEENHYSKVGDNFVDNVTVCTLNLHK